MTVRSLRILAGLIASILLACLWIAPVQAEDSDKWRIHVEDDTETGGELLFRFHPRGAYPFDLTVQVAAETEENDIAKRIREVFHAELPPGGYKVEVENGEEVVVEGREGTGVFSLVLLKSTVSGAQFEIEKD